MTRLLILLILGLSFANLNAAENNIDKILKTIENESGCSLHINSGKRTKAHNKRIGGAKNSLHLHDRARDFRSNSKSANCNLERISLTACKYASVIVYPSHIHIDDRKTRICVFAKKKANKPRVSFVVMDNMKFYPNVTYVNPGWKVVWFNNSKKTHNAYPHYKKLLRKGKSGSKIFKKSGTYPYYCQPHKSKGMKGRIIVNGTK